MILDTLVPHHLIILTITVLDPIHNLSVGACVQRCARPVTELLHKVVLSEKSAYRTVRCHCFLWYVRSVYYRTNITVKKME
jgi:hypothetical protein